jgi:hypothetical protein
MCVASYVTNTMAFILPSPADTLTKDSSMKWHNSICAAIGIADDRVYFLIIGSLSIAYNLFWF